MKSKKILFLAAAIAALGVASSVASPPPKYTAVVNADGSLARGVNAVSATRVATGQYEVAFTKNVTLCGYTAAVGLSGAVGSSDPGTVVVAGRSHNKKAIFVQTFGATNTLADLGFHVIVAC